MKIKNNKTNALKKNSHILTKRIYVLSLIFITTLLFSNTINNGFTNWDDDKYIIENPYIKDFSFNGVYKIFTEPYFTNYHPLTTLSYLFEYHYFGENPYIYHLFNYFLHIINTVFVFIFIGLILRNNRIAFVTALLFSVHPMHVESVAWISERKDLLFACFFLLSLICYTKYILSGSINVKFVVFAFIFFLLSLLSKAAAITLPIIILLLHYHINKKLTTRDLITSVPFFIMSVVFGIILLTTQEKALTETEMLYTGINKIILLMYPFSFYAWRFILPLNMSPLHVFPNPENIYLPYHFYMAPIVIIGLILIWKLSKNENKNLIAFGLLFFAFNLIPVIQLIPFGKAIVAERYTYIPYIGLSYIGAFFFEKYYVKKNKSVILMGISFVVFLIINTWQQNKIWANSITLWSKAIEVNENNYHAYRHRADAYSSMRNFKAALADFDKAISINRKYLEAYNNRATARKEAGDINGALEDYNQVININPNFAPAYFNIANIKHYIQSDFQGAMKAYNLAIELDKSYADAYNNRGSLKLKLENFIEAIDDFNKALSIKPEFALAYNNRGYAKSLLNLFDDAVFDFNKAIQLNKNFSLAYVNRANAHLNLNNTNLACADFIKAKALGYPDLENFINTYCK